MVVLLACSVAGWKTEIEEEISQNQKKLPHWLVVIAYNPWRMMNSQQRFVVTVFSVCHVQLRLFLHSLNPSLFPPSVLCSDRVGQVTKTYHDIKAVTHLLEEVRERHTQQMNRIIED